MTSQCVCIRFTKNDTAYTKLNKVAVRKLPVSVGRAFCRRDKPYSFIEPDRIGVHVRFPGHHTRCINPSNFTIFRRFAVDRTLRRHIPYNFADVAAENSAYSGEDVQVGALHLVVDI